MKKERVRGRLKVEIDGQLYKVEMTTAGISVRKHKTRQVYAVPFQKVIQLCHPQLDLFEAGRVK